MKYTKQKNINACFSDFITCLLWRNFTHFDLNRYDSLLSSKLSYEVDKCLFEDETLKLTVFNILFSSDS